MNSGLFVRPLILILTLFLTARLVSAADYEVEKLEALPEDLAAGVASALSPNGYRVTGPDGALCDIWLAKQIPMKDGFTPTLSVKYGLHPGQFVGVFRVGEDAEFSDFREQVLEPGLYTVRYGQQPEDGNHIGTSDLADFLLALPAEEDESAEAMDDLDELNEISAEAAGSSHPAIFALFPVEGSAAGAASLTHDADRDFWILQVSGGGEEPVAFRMVVVGFAEE